jgi:hypothetical protein
MEILFNAPRLCRLCNSKAALTRRWGPERAEVLCQRLHELAGVDSLADVRFLVDDELRAHAGRVVVPIDGTLSIVVAAPRGKKRLGRGDLADVRTVVIEAIRTPKEDVDEP